MTEVDYMQIPCDILKKENLDRLERHCKKAIHYERGNIREEHEVVLALLYQYQNSVPKEAIREKIKEILKYKEIAENQIEEKIIIADSDSLNFGRKQAHEKDVEVLKEILGE